MMKKVVAILVLLMTAAVCAQAPNDTGVPAHSTLQPLAPLDISGTGAFTGSEPTMSPRFFRSGVPGDACSTFSSGNFQYQLFPFYTDNSGELTVTFDPGPCGTGIYVTFHTGSFNPANICENYHWSFGSSQSFTETFDVPANTQMVMVVSSSSANAPNAVCGDFTYQMIGANLAPIPAINEWGLIALLAGLTLAGGWFIWKQGF